MARELRKRPLTLIPVGPLTNIALLIAMHPDLVENIEDIVVMGGAIGLGNVTPSAEFNIWCDPEAAKRVFESDADVTMVGLDVTHRAMLSAARAEALRETGHAGAVVADLHAFYRRFHLEVYGHDDTPVHDALAVAHVIDPKILHTAQLNVELDVTQGPCRGRTVVDQLRRTDRPAERPRRRRRGRRPLHRPADRPDRLAGLSDAEYPFLRRLGAFPLRTGRTEFRVWAPEPDRGPAAHRRRRPRARARRATASTRRRSTPRRATTTSSSLDGDAAARPVLALAAGRAARPVARLRPRRVRVDRQRASAPPASTTP